jgi:hypothetical protein
MAKAHAGMVKAHAGMAKAHAVEHTYSRGVMATWPKRPRLRMNWLMPVSFSSVGLWCGVRAYRHHEGTTQSESHSQRISPCQCSYIDNATLHGRHASLREACMTEVYHECDMQNRGCFKGKHSVKQAVADTSAPARIDQGGHMFGSAQSRCHEQPRARGDERRDSTP